MGNTVYDDRIGVKNEGKMKLRKSKDVSPILQFLIVSRTNTCLNLCVCGFQRAHFSRLSTQCGSQDAWFGCILSFTASAFVKKRELGADICFPVKTHVRKFSGGGFVRRDLFVPNSVGRWQFCEKFPGRL